MMTLACAFLAATAAAPPESSSPAARAAMEAITARMTEADVRGLCAFGTRHTLSETESQTRGIGAARRWLHAQLQEAAKASGGRMEVSFEEFDVPPMARLPAGAKVVNVVAVLKGTMPEAADLRYYVVGHYDTINSDRMDAISDAPGANDDASGTAVVLACARALAAAPLDATVVFLCTAAEEQGLVGAKFHADSARARGENVMGVLSNDIVGDPSVPFIGGEAIGGDGPAREASSFVRIFSEALPRSLSAEQLNRVRQLGAENDSPSRQLARYVAYVSRREKTEIAAKMMFRTDRFLRGGDHSAFNDAGYAAVRFSVPAEDYSRQHVHVTERDGKPYGDIEAFVDFPYIAKVARLNAATLVHIANAPRPPGKPRLITRELTMNTLVRWEKSPEPDTAGYEVLWRETTSPDWQGVVDAGDATELRLPVSKDNFFFAVRAYDRDGFRSPAVFCGAERE